MRVEQSLYFGYLPLTNVRGFRDANTDALVTNPITTDVLDMKNVRDTWQQLHSRDRLAVEPVLEFGMSTHYTLEGDSSNEPSRE